MKKAKTVKAWAIVCHGKVWMLKEMFGHEGYQPLYATRKEARFNLWEGARVARVEIREIK